LVFTRTKHGASRAAQLLKRKKITVDAIHGDKTQSARTRALEGFRAGKIRVLVATDIAARGIDVDNVSHVFNYDLPSEPETYVHRIGRTARAGAEGMALSFCSGLELADLKQIEKLIGFKIQRNENHKFHSQDAVKGLVDGIPAVKVKKLREQEKQERLRKYKESKKKSGSSKKTSSSGAKTRRAPGEQKSTAPKAKVKKSGNYSKPQPWKKRRPKPKR